MANLTTHYMGIGLKNPIILGANNMVNQPDQIKKAEEAGIAAIVYKTLFEEQVQLEALQLEEELHEYDNRSAEMGHLFPEIEHAGPQEHLIQLRKLKESVSIPVIASLNAVNQSTWIEYAVMLEQTGIDGLEINFYRTPVSTETESLQIESQQIEILKEIKARVRIPVGVKLSPFYTNPLNFIARLDEAGANAFVLFNRFFQPEINIDTEAFYFPWELTRKGDYQVTIRYIGLLYNQIKASLVASRGIKTGADVVKMLLAGAHAVQMVSAFYEEGIQHATHVLHDLEKWMDRKGYQTLDEFRGKLSRQNIHDEFAYNRAQYVEILKNSEEIFKKYPMR